MKTTTGLRVTLISIVLSACASTPAPTPPSELPSATLIPPTATVLATPTPQGTIHQVTSSAASGPGTLRQALMDAQPHDIITFDPSVFPPDSPTTIPVATELPAFTQGHLTIDASNAGVILDGSELPRDTWIPGLSILSNDNKVRGLQIIHFTGAGILLAEGAAHNIIGGQAEIGTGPLGEGNLSSANSDGIAVFGGVENTIMGNLIGTDVVGTHPFGNLGTGILLHEAARGNVVGPGNVIAFNGDSGIDIRSIDSTGNTITQNSIHDNLGPSIHSVTGASGPASPAILSFDLQSGTVEGVACPLCVVEVYSGDGADAEIYEASVEADQDGAFELSTGRSLGGPALKATATRMDGSTSTFSLPTAGTYQAWVLQRGNYLPRTQFQPRQSRDLEDNRIATHTETKICPREMYDQCLAEMAGLGLKRIRLSFNEVEVPFDLTVPEFSIGQIEDAWIDTMVSNGMAVTYVMSFWDKEYQNNGGVLGCPRFRADAEIQAYLEYLEFVVQHFKERINYFEIWNEPNTGACPQAIEVDDYVELVRRTIPVLRREAPRGKIVVGAVTWLHDPASQEYLFAILNSDIMPRVDAISWHPFYGASPEYPDVADYYYTYPSLVRRIQGLASAAGFRGEYTADELTWRTPINTLADHPWVYSEITAAKYYARGVVMHLGMDVAVGVMVDPRLTVVSSTVRNLATIMAGAHPASLSVNIDAETTGTMSYAFLLPNGEKLLALWTNRAAADHAPGVTATLTFPGSLSQQVVAIDPLNGFQQQLRTDLEDGSLVVPDLIVMDYPIVLRLTP